MKKVIFEKIYRDERLISESYFKDETSLDLHREDGPAKIIYRKNGNIDYEEYYKDGVLHREDGPAKIRYYNNGDIEYEEYYKNGNLHREDGPAKIRYYYNGNIRDEEYYKDGVLISVGIVRNQGCV